MFRPLLAAARRGAGVRCSRGGRPLRRCRLLGLRRPLAAAAVRRPLGRAGRLLPAWAAAASSRWRTRCSCSPTPSPRWTATSAPPATTTAPGSCRAARQRHPVRDQARRRPVPRARLGEHDEQRPGGQHLVFDAEVVDGLVYAYRAREALQLPASTVEKIRNAIHRTARGKFWRYPTIRLNQVNWYALMYAADATVTGDNDPAQARPAPAAQALLLPDPRPGSRIGNFGPGMRFHYLPHMSVNDRSNVDSAEYSNIVLTFTRFYDQARRAGMPALDPVRAARHARVDHARRLRLLDARRLHELGLRPGLQALAPGQEARADAGGPGRPRLLGHAAPERQVGPVGEVDARQRLRLLRPACRSARKDGLVDPVLFDLNAVPAGRRQRPARRGARPGQRRPRGRRRARHEDGRDARRRCTPTTPTSAASP